MKPRHLICALLAAAVVLVPSDALARKKKKSHNKKVVTIEQPVAVASTPQPVPITDAATQLYGEWNIVTMRHKPVASRERAYLYLDFAAHKVYGNNGCNSLNGVFAQQGNDMTFRDMITTSETCHSGTSERTVMKTLGEVQHCELTKLGQVEWLTLTNAKGQELMTLRRQNLDFMGGVWLVSRAAGEDVAASNVRLVIDPPMRSLHGDTGCNIINGIINIDPTKDFAIQFEDLHSSGNPCDNIDTETSVLIALEQTVNCCRGEGGQMLLTNERGDTTMVLTPLKLTR